MLESRLVVYTILAITLGYLLTSAIPNQLSPKPLFEGTSPDSELRAPDASTDSNEEILGSKQDESTSAQATDEINFVSNGLRGELTALSTLIVNLSIAFTVYWLAKRKFS